jgi:transcription elongation factor GreB
MTPECYETLLGELRYLADVERPKVVDEVSAAAAQGDRSENAEYIYGKKRLREIDRRLYFLKSRLEMAKIIDPEKQQSTTIQFGAKVTLEDENGLKKVWHIVGEDEAAPSRGLISWRSPIGAALLNKRVDDEIEVSTPQGEIYYRITAFRFDKRIAAVSGP